VEAGGVSMRCSLAESGFFRRMRKNAYAQ
jgi:hypothetical protein